MKEAFNQLNAVTITAEHLKLRQEARRDYFATRYDDHSRSSR